MASSSEPRLGAIRLAWWRERLEELDAGVAAPAEPRLEAVAAELIPRGINGNQLSQLEDAWLPLLKPFPWGVEQADALMLRGTILFDLAGRLLGRSAGEAGQAGALWSLMDGSDHCSDHASRQMLRARAADLLGAMTKPMPRKLRVLTVLGALAAADLVREGSGLKRLSAAVRHRLVGGFPHS